MTATLMISENTALAARSQVERMTGIEPALSAWEADVLPLNYIRKSCRSPPADGHLRRPCQHIVQEHLARLVLLGWTHRSAVALLAVPSDSQCGEN
jgi:hypothetical protein